MRKQDRLGAAEIAGWSAVGLGVGLLAGVLAGQWVGLVNGGRLRRAWEGRGAERPGPRAPVAAARLVRQALADHPDLAPLGLTVLGVSPGVVELGGWVETRRLRAQASRYAREVPGIDSVINRILVRGEDDISYTDLQVTNQPA